MTGTFWAILPPVIAIVLALITKEVYLSLMIGIASGALMYHNFHLIKAMDTIFAIMGEKIGANCDILIFLVLLGILVALITKSGASRAYGKWAAKAIRTKRQALFATICLGVVIFVDDYFNCLTVGTVMRPVTDKHNVTRAKLAYVIDATAAPVCIIGSLPPVSFPWKAIQKAFHPFSFVYEFPLSLHLVAAIHHKISAYFCQAVLHLLLEPIQK